MKRRSLIAGLGAGTAILGAPMLARAQNEITLRIGAAHPTPALPYVFTHDTYFIPEVIKRAKEKSLNVRFVKAWAGVVAKVDGMMEAVQKGTLDLGCAAPGFEASRIGILNWANIMLFNPTDPMQQTRIAMKMMRDLPELRAVFNKFNTEILALHVSENYGHPLVKPVTKPEDLKGRKMSIAAVSAPWLTSIGAVPVPMSIAEVYSAMQTGLLEGNTYFLSGMVALRLNEVAKYFYRTEAGVAPNIALVMNLDTRKRLPQELVAIIDKVAEETAYKTAEINAQRDRDAEEQLKGKVTIIQISAEDKRRWAEAMKDIPGRIAKELDAKGEPGSKVFKTYLQLVAQSGHKWPLEYPI